MHSSSCMESEQFLSPAWKEGNFKISAWALLNVISAWALLLLNGTLLILQVQDTMTRQHAKVFVLVLASILATIPAARSVPGTDSPSPPSPSPTPPSPSLPPPSPPSYGYNDGITYTTECDITFSEPGACDFTPLALYPDSSTWLDSVSVPIQYQNQPRTYR